MSQTVLIFTKRSNIQKYNEMQISNQIIPGPNYLVYVDCINILTLYSHCTACQQMSNLFPY